MRVEQKLIELNAKAVAEFKKLPPVPNQRPIKEKHVLFLLKKMEEGSYHGADLATVVHKGVEYSCNGQHSVEAVGRFGKSVPAVHKKFVTNGESDAEVARIFGNIDQGLPRSLRDVVGSYKKLAGLESMSTPLLANCVSALDALADGAFAHNGMTPRSRAERADLLFPNKAACLFVNAIIGECSRAKVSHMYRVPVFASMISSWRVRRDAAGEFWVKVRDGEMLKKSDPAWVLMRYLTSSNIGSNTGEKNFAFIKECIAAGLPPTVREIGQHFGIGSPNGVCEHLKALEVKGAITRSRHSARGIVVPGMVPGVGEELYVRRGDSFVRLADVQARAAGGGET